MYSCCMKYLLFWILLGLGHTKTYFVSTKQEPQFFIKRHLVLQTEVSPFLCLINSNPDSMYISFESLLKFVHTSLFSLLGQMHPNISCQLAIQWGKKQNTQFFSSACPIDPDTEVLLEEMLKLSIDVAHCFQILHDITKVTQFSLVWGDHIGYLTQPTLYTGDDNVTVIIGSFSDIMGQALPVAIPLDAFTGMYMVLK
jgi:hypothetical protein